MYVWCTYEIAGAPGLGARGCLDGEDCCYQVWNQETEMGNLEVLELVPPYFGEIAVVPNSGGAGKYRGGNDAVSIINIYGTEFTSIVPTAITCTWITAPNSQIFGGYPGPTPTFFVVRNSKEKWAGGRINLKELALAPWKGINPVEYLKERAPDAEIHIFKRLKCFQVRDGDVAIALGFGGNGGLGDPIERDPKLVEKDLNLEKITPEAAERIYKVKLVETPEAAERVYKVDEEETKKLREEERRNRLKRGIPVKEWWKKQREIVLKKQFHELLKEAYQSSSRVSRRWSQEFKEFWCLPEDFKF
ncbi:hypothetical protein DRP07_05615 [Archaeoglobales archaeon]|nr:MAG: hypothetical protein DRP07_05615 [Archaeoglobales archaeon]